MIVHLAASLRDPKTDIAYLQKIIEIVHKHDAVLSHNWLEAAIARKKEAISVPDWTPYVQANLDALKHSDIVIIDLTHYAFSQGFLAAAALESNKPVLAVSRSDSQDTLARGISSPLFTLKKYSTAADLSTIVDTFIEQNTVHTKDLRFNMFLTRRIFKYLEETSKRTGKSRSEIIRDLVKKKANEESRRA